MSQCVTIHHNQHKHKVIITDTNKCDYLVQELCPLITGVWTGYGADLPVYVGH